MRIIDILINLMTDPKKGVDGCTSVDSNSQMNKLPKRISNKNSFSFDVSNFLDFQQITAFWHISDQLTKCSKTIFNNVAMRKMMQAIQQNIYEKIHGFTMEFISMHTPLRAVPVQVRACNNKRIATPLSSTSLVYNMCKGAR